MTFKMPLIILILCLTLFWHTGCQKQGHTVAEIISTEKLSDIGSTRATAYNMSAKIISDESRIFVTWLDQPADIRIKALDLKRGEWGKTVTLGKGVDNHSGAALTMDSAGYLYAAFGPHHGPFQFKRTKSPHDITEWVTLEDFGFNATYPSLVCGPKDTLFIAYRSSTTDPWRLLLQRRAPGGTWSEAVPVLDTSVKDYAQFGNVLAFDQSGRLHLGFHIYDFHPPAGKSIGYLYSDAGGRSWHSASGEKMELPATPESKCFIEQGEALDMRIGTLAVDSKGYPWLTAIHLEKSPRTVLLWHYDGEGWRSTDLLEFVEPVRQGGELVSGSLSIDRDDVIYIACAVADKLDRELQYWGHPSQEMYLMVSFDSGATFNVQPVSSHDAEAPNWLANIERPYSARPIGTPAFLYTHGVAGSTLHCSDSTEVYFNRIQVK
jgi:hypothetical protein